MGAKQIALCVWIALAPAYGCQLSRGIAIEDKAIQTLSMDLRGVYYGRDITSAPHKYGEPLLWAKDKSSIVRWAKNIHGRENSGVKILEPKERTVNGHDVVAVFDMTGSGLNYWTVYVFENDSQHRWHCALFIESILLDRFTEIYSVQLSPNNTLILREKDGAEIVEYPLAAPVKRAHRNQLIRSSESK